MRKKIIYIYACVQLLISVKAFSQDGFIEGKPTLAYWKVGTQAQTIIVLHGGPGAAHNYLRPEWDQLSKVAQVIYYDQRGCGKSDKAQCYSYKEQVEDLKRVVTSFAKGRKVILAGSSWGSILALLFAYSYPEDVKALILSGTVSWMGLGQPPQECISYKPEVDINKYPLAHMDTVRYISFTKGTQINKLEVDDKIIELRTLARSVPLQSMKEAPSKEQLQSITHPVLIFEGKGKCYLQDAAQEYITILPNVRKYVVAEACHDPWYSHPDEFFRESIKFIETIN